MLPFQRLVKRYGAGAAFFAAATPIPRRPGVRPARPCQIQPRAVLHRHPDRKDSPQLRHRVCLALPWTLHSHAVPGKH